MSIRKFRYGDTWDKVNDDLATFGRFWDYGIPSFTFMEGSLYNPETHDLIPKESYKKKQLELKKKQLAEFKERRANEAKAYDELEKSMQTEIDQLSRSLSP